MSPMLFQDSGYSDLRNLTDGLKDANRQLNAAKQATPENIRHLFRSSIRFDKITKAYCWYWVLKGN